MKNGDVNEFVERIHCGDELVFTFNGQKFFLQGADETWDKRGGCVKKWGKLVLALDRWEPPSDDYVWIGVGDEKRFPVEEFLNARLWDGKSFWEAEHLMEWVDS